MCFDKLIKTFIANKSFPDLQGRYQLQQIFTDKIS